MATGLQGPEEVPCSTRLLGPKEVPSFSDSDASLSLEVKALLLKVGLPRGLSLDPWGLSLGSLS